MILIKIALVLLILTFAVGIAWVNTEMFSDNKRKVKVLGTAFYAIAVLLGGCIIAGIIGL